MHSFLELTSPSPPRPRSASPPEDADEAAEQYGAPELGTIQVSVRRVEATYMQHARPIPPSRFQAPGPVHERSKKAGAHCVQYVPFPFPPPPLSARS